MSHQALLDRLASVFAARRPPQRKRFPSPDQRRGAAPVAKASVALVVRPATDGLELLVIKRATRAGDPWSGHMAFPGGRESPADQSARETAERETYEEVGIQLSSVGRLLGSLDEVWPRAGAPAVRIAPYVYSVPRESPIRPNHEVEAAFWIPVRHLWSPESATEYLHALASGEELRFPAIAYDSHVIWGLTHRILSQFLELVRRAVDGEEER